MHSGSNDDFERVPGEFEEAAVALSGNSEVIDGVTVGAATKKPVPKLSSATPRTGRPMKRVYIVLAVSAAVVLAGLVWFQIRASRTSSANAKKIEQLCLGAKFAMEDDARDFESGDTRRQEAAYTRFYSSHELYHGVDSLLYCVDKLPEIPPNCQYGKDWACLAKIARQIRASIP